jgi:hypothetical protein
MILLAKCARRPRAHHIDALTDDIGLAFVLGLTALPNATHLGSYRSAGQCAGLSARW